MLALVCYGALVAWRRASTPPPLAKEQQITANPREAPITAAVISRDGKYVAYSDTTGLTFAILTPVKFGHFNCPRGSTLFLQAGFPTALIFC